MGAAGGERLNARCPDGPWLDEAKRPLPASICVAHMQRLLAARHTFAKTTVGEVMGARDVEPEASQSDPLRSRLLESGQLVKPTATRTERMSTSTTYSVLHRLLPGT